MANAAVVPNHDGHALTERTIKVLQSPSFPVQNISLEPSMSEMFFTGWKFTSNFDSNPGYVSQIIKRLESPEGKAMYAYTNLPGKEQGVLAEGAVMNIGTARVTLDGRSATQFVELLVDGAEAMIHYLETLGKSGYKLWV